MVLLYSRYPTSAMLATRYFFDDDCKQSDGIFVLLLDRISVFGKRERGNVDAVDIAFLFGTSKLL